MRLVVQASFDPPSDARRIRDEALVIHQRESPSHNRRLIVFIHGLGGSRYTTWGQLPGLIYEDIPAADVGLYSYRTGLRRLRFWRSVGIPTEANVLADLVRDLTDYDSVLLIGHSLGGVLAKGAIARFFTTNQLDVLRRIHGLILMASPQLGSFRVPQSIGRFSPDMVVLRTNSRYLKEINQIFQDHLRIRKCRQVTFPRNLPTWAIIASADWWVDELSSSIHLPSSQRMMSRDGHQSLVKPVSREADAYRYLIGCVSTVYGLKAPSPARSTGWEKHTCACATMEDLPEIRDLGRKFFGDDISPLELMREWVAADPEVFWTLKRRGESGARLVGYFCLLRLTEAGRQLVENGTLTGVTITPAYLSRDCEKTACVYIAAVAGTDSSARALIMEKLESRLLELAKSAKLTLLTRPITKDGLRITNQYRLKAIAGGPTEQGKICVGTFP